MRRIVRAVLGLLSIIVASAASAAPLLGIEVQQDNAPIGFASSGSGASTICGPTSSALPGYGAAASGVPLLSSPSLSGGTIGFCSLSGFRGLHTFAMAFTRGGPGADGNGGGLLSRLASGVTAKLVGLIQTVSSVTVGNWIDAGKGAYAKTTLPGARTFTANGAGVSPTFVSDAGLAPGSQFSETTLISAAFTGRSGSVVASAQIVAVPEPASLMLFGTALMSLGLVMASPRHGTRAG